MEFSLILFSILSFTTWMNLVQAMTGPVNACPCFYFSKTKVRACEIKRHFEQKEGICSIKAIVFWTINEKIICSDPDDKWAKKVLKKRQQEMTVTPRSKTPESPTSILSTPTSAPETEPSSTPTYALLVTATELSSQTSFPGSEPTSTPKTTAPRSQTPSTPTSAQSSTRVRSSSSSSSSSPSFPGSEPTSTPKTTAPRSQPLSTTTSAEPSTIVTSTTTSAESSTRVRLSSLSSSSSSSSSFPGSEHTSTTSTSKTTVPRSQPPSTPTSTPSSTITLSSSSSFPGSESTATSAPSSLTFSTPTSAPSRTLTAILPLTSRPNNPATVPSTRTVSDRIRATFMARRKAFTRRRFTTRRRPKKNLKAWQKKCSKKLL